MPMAKPKRTTWLWCGVTCLSLLVSTRLPAQELKSRATCKGHTGYVYSISISPDGETLASASYDKTIKLWEMATGKELATLKGHTEIIWAVAFSPDGKTVASGDGDSTKGTIKLWDAATRKVVGAFDGHKALVKCLAFSPDGATLASGSWDETIKLWDTKTRKVKATLKGHALVPSGVWSVGFSPDGKLLASGDEKVRVWEIQTSKELFSRKGGFLGVFSVAFGKESKIVASASPGTALKIWVLNDKKEVATLEGPESPAISLAFSRDGNLLAGAWTYANTIKLFEMPSGKETCEVESVFPTCMAFSPDRKTLASGSLDSTITLWDISANKRVGK